MRNTFDFEYKYGKLLPGKLNNNERKIIDEFLDADFSKLTNIFLKYKKSNKITDNILIFYVLTCNVYEFMNVPEKLKTYDLCLEIVNQRPSLIKYVPKIYIDDAILKLSAKFDRVLIYLHKLKVEISDELYGFFLNVNQNHYEYFPDEQKRNIEFIYKAIVNNGEMIEYVPKDLRTILMIFIASKSYVNAFQYIIKYEYVTDIYTNYIINEIGYQPFTELRYYKLQTPKQCLNIVMKDSSNTNYVNIKLPKNFLSITSWI